jgi:hypothetical protein
MISPCSLLNNLDLLLKNNNIFKSKNYYIAPTSNNKCRVLNVKKFSLYFVYFKFNHSFFFKKIFYNFKQLLNQIVLNIVVFYGHIYV